MIRAFGHALGLLLAALVLWAPLPFASVTPAPARALMVASWIALGIALVACTSLDQLRPIRGPALALGLLGCLGLLQSIELPRAVVESISPRHVEVYQQADAVLPEAELRPTLSLAPPASLATAGSLFSAAALLMAAAAAGGDRARRRLLAVSVALAALFQIVYGARHLLAGATRIWGIEVPNLATRLRGTYVNPNHMALLLEMALAVSLAWLWWGLQRHRRRVSVETRTMVVLLAALLWVGCAAALVATGSRAGMLAALTATAAQCLWVPAGAAQRRWQLAGGAVLVAGLLALVPWILRSAPAGAVAASGEVSLGSRLEAYRSSLGLVPEYPLLGTGLGTFQEIFPVVQPASLAPGVWRHAHNDWLELLITGGVVGFAVLVAGVWLLGRRLTEVRARGRRSEDRAAALAALGALVAVGLHELLDFGLTMPANVVILCVVLGAAAGARTDPGPVSRST